MIRIKVAELMGRHKLTQTKLAEMTGIRPNTVSALWHGTIKRIEIDQINRLCKALKCQPGDLFEYVSDDEDSHSQENK
ncbi:helix-turn-helix domain-containing protein [Effusibacillus pohliae]|uniref:helix-turn-helix domain-containing protein n=1 Tax=Effusibacillus pohliae TaxID=232270 RepID=UPI0003741061|nr:helix-turn-helix transcriptional regulator [Effusibacillus pohliae]